MFRRTASSVRQTKKPTRYLQEAKDYADQTMKLFHKFHNDYVDTAAVERERQKLRQKLNKTEQKMSQPAAKKKPKKELTAKDVRPGDTVRVLSMNLKGTISTRPDSKGYLFVQMGIIRSKVHISDLELIDEPVITTPSLSREPEPEKSACQNLQASPPRSTFSAKPLTRRLQSWTSIWMMHISHI